ncbi:MAG: O-antigen ligase family protein [Devosia sp.]|uniref:O-antigen ligase family protein n=1 Tax=Devosia sp. TaxID=1871048 RepID=UPI001AD3577B|nr:O-antigen ligase family protein [Devosia sp.]MBN9316196.1 O-antigen ligase family protein [Devosia sp.]
MSVAAEGSVTPAPPIAQDGAPVRMVPRPAPASGPRLVPPTMHRLNTVVSVAIMALLVLAPIPLGSNRPAFWMIWSTAIGCLAFTYGLVLLRLRAPPRLGLAVFASEVALVLSLCAYVAVQTLPLGGLLPQVIRRVETLGISPATLSLDPGSSRLVLIQFLTFGLLFFLAAQVAANRLRARRMLLGILVIIALFAVVGLVSLTQLGDTLLGFEKQIYRGYATATFINRNSFATFLAVGLTLGTAILLEAVALRRELPLGRLLGTLALVAGCMAVIGAALVATGSRLGTVAGVGGAATALVLGTMAFRGIGRVGFIVAFVLLGTALAVVGTFGMSLVERLVLLPTVDESRVDAHRLIWAAIFERPWLGYGAGSFATVFQAFQRPPLSAESVWNNSHSTYLALWFEMGLVAGSIPLVVIALLGLRTARGARDPASAVVSVATLGVIVVFAIHSLLDFSAEIEANAFLFTVILALGAAGGLGRNIVPAGHGLRPHTPLT